MPPRNNAKDEKHNHWMRNRNLREIKCYGRMKWQNDRASTWGTGINLDCKLLLQNYSFNILKINRIEFFSDFRNERSRFAVKKLGATEEGVLRQHIILDDGYLRDTVVYSILKYKWLFLSSKLIEKSNSVHINEIACR